MSNLYPLRGLATGLLTLLSFILTAADIQVTNVNDSGAGSLRAAVMEAAPGDRITFAASTNFNNLNLTSGEIVIDKDLTINGNGLGRTIITGNQTNRVFNIMGGATVIISELRLVNGRTNASGGALQNVDGTVYLRAVFIKSSRAFGKLATQGGGAIHNRGTMYIRESLITRSQALGQAGSGGGILNGAGGTLEIMRSIIADNTANRAGGGIEDASGGGSSFTIDQTTIRNNTVFTAPGNGGGVHVGGDGSLSVTDSKVYGNEAGQEGGGLWIGSGTLTISDTEIYDNEGQGDDADDGGGGLFNNGGTLLVRSGTKIYENRATGMSGSGGGILNAMGGTLRVQDAFIFENTANRAGGGIEDVSGASTQFTILNTSIKDNITGEAPGNGGGVHITGDGNLFIQGSHVSGNLALAEGGGLWNSVGTMTVNRTVIDGNTALGDAATQGGGGLFNNGGTLRVGFGTQVMRNNATGDAGSGGGIFNAEGGTLSVTGAIISDNAANRAGGGIEDASGSTTDLYVRSTTMEENFVFFSPGNGGAIHVGSDGDSYIIGGEFNDNLAGAEGGALWNNSVGTMTVSGATIEFNLALGDEADQGGGGIYNDGGTLNVAASTVDYNLAPGLSGSGGGLLSVGGDVFVAGGSLSYNESSRAGGGVELAAGNYESVDVDYNYNITGDAPGNGGAFHITSGEVVNITGGEVTYNQATNEGGGIWNQAGTKMTLSGVSINYNEVTGEMATGGGGVFNNGGVLDIQFSTVAYNNALGDMTVGGGVASIAGGDIDILTSTISTNTAGGSGGGVSNEGKAFIEYSTIALNTAAVGGGYNQSMSSADLTIVGTAISDNMADRFPDFGATAGRVNSEGFNLISDDSGNQFPARSTGREGMSANFGPLADNGGPTMTHVPQCPSPVIDHGNPFYNVVDQRGEMVFGRRRDIGAVEKQENCPSSAVASDALAASPTLTVEGLELSPNPARQFTMARLPENLSGQPLTFRIFSSEGRLVADWKSSSISERIDVANYVPGTYTLRVVDGETTHTSRFVVVR